MDGLANILLVELEGRASINLQQTLACILFRMVSAYYNLFSGDVYINRIFLEEI
jgi:hypothetical protein